MSFRPHNKLRQLLIIALVALIVLLPNIHPFFVPRARAFELPVIDVQLLAAFAEEKVELGFLTALSHAAGGALLNGVTFFIRKLAHDTAVAISEGNVGQGKLFFDKEPGEYFKDAALGAAGEAINAFGEPLGLDLCQIPNPRINVFLQVGLRNIFPEGTEPKPKCEWQQIRGQWGNISNVLAERYGRDGRVNLSSIAAQTFNANISVSQSDFGVAMGAIAKVDEKQVGAGLNANLERIIGEGLKDVKGAISGRIKTPSDLIKEDLKQLSTKEQQELSAGQIAGLYAAELTNLPYLAGFAANIFLNTLASRLLNKLTTGLFPEDKPSAGGSSFSFFDQAPSRLGEQAERALSFLLAPTIQEASVYNLLDTYSACPPQSPGLNNCVMDNGMRQAIDRAKQAPLTIKEAMDEGLLHAEWPLISPRREEDNTTVAECYLNKYCYSNLQKLRKVRIFPLGFELAALKSSPDQPWNLGQVVAGFNTCNAAGVADARNPFCHLIDPNWVIKIAPVRCQTKLAGPFLVDKNTAIRQEECMDLQTCIVEDENGTCQNWGYCTRERNTWRLGGEVCPSYFNTCTTYRNRDDNSQVSYLSRTVDFGECSAANAGCRAYSTEQENDTWVTPAALGLSVAEPANLALKQAGRNRVLHFNKQAQTCDPSADGCTAFYNARRSPSGQFVQESGAYVREPNNLVHLKRAPDYLGCYDINRAVNSPEINWPQTRAQAINEVSNHPRCAQYAAACAPSEVGCELYTPATGGTAIPGVISTPNVCDARCVGYETFREEAPPGGLSGSRFPLYFIPNSPNAQQCSAADEGCEEFTSLEAAAAGGEQTQYFSYVRACERPTGTNEKTFFSWEGSEREGYVLRTHRLLPIDQTAFTYIQGLANNAAPNDLAFNVPDTVNTVFPIGSPAYNDTTLANLRKEYNTCNAAGYTLLLNSPFSPGAASADCRALYDSAGNIYYRILSDTVTVSPQCARLRKTDSRLYVDAALTAATRAAGAAPAGQTLCERQGGLWGDADRDGQNDCQRCFGGGRYQDGICVYQTIPAESRQCGREAVGCRAYTGNTGNNVNPRLVYDSFETTATSAAALRAATADWFPAAAVSIAAESLQVGGHSLAVNGNTVFRMIATGILQFGEWYELEFWARGTAQNVAVHLANDLNTNGQIETTELTNRITRDVATNQDVTITISGEWRRYRLGPVQFTGASNLASGLVFVRTAIGQAQPYYLDFVRIGKLEDRLYLIKDSWKTAEGRDVPLVCDANPTDPFPGAALGCQVYTDSQKNQIFVTGFSSLCREAAIGCQPLYESHNTVGEARAKIYNLRCAGLGGQTCRVVVAGQELGNCRVGVGQTSCYIPEVTLPTAPVITLAAVNTAAPGSVVTSTIYIPAEANTTPIFLTNRANVQCRDTERGCMRLGLQNRVVPDARTTAVEYTDAYIINDPARYVTTAGQTQSNGILCREDTIGCGEFQAEASTAYFKDPRFTGNSLCAYKTEVQVGANKASGWFRAGVGRCSNSPITNPVSCRRDDDCGAGNRCLDIGAVPCYPTQQATPNVYDIFSNRSAPYLGFVGQCEPAADKCTELVDPLDRTAQSPAGRAYYRVFDERLTDRIGECKSQVGLKEGCVLFDRTDQPNKIYSTALTYAASDAANPRYSLVTPRSESDRNRNNTNLILKVDRDRSCSEWLACRNSVVVKNDDYPGGRRLCSQYKACNATEPGKECTNFPDPPLTDRFLDENVYTSRDVSWFGADYSGYSLFNRYQITDYTYVSFPGDLNQYLAYQADDRLFRTQGDRNDPNRTDFGNLGCRPDPNVEAAQRDLRTGQPCGIDSQGRCYQDKCLYPVEGVGERRFDSALPPGMCNNSTLAAPVFCARAGDCPRGRCIIEGLEPERRELINRSNLERIKRGINAPSCKGHPEKDSPFPEYLAADYLDSPHRDYVGWTDIRATPRNLSPEGDLLPLVIPSPTAGGNQQLKARRAFSAVDKNFQDANLCQNGNCSCEYNKYEYADGTTDYFGPATTEQIGRSVPDGVCSGGTRDEYPCQIATAAVDCLNGGTCNQLKKKEIHLGIKGFCLEPDLSRPINGLAKPGTGRRQEYACLTWLPIQTSATKVDLLNRYQEAGYFPVQNYDGPDTGTGGELYCAAVDRGGLYDAAVIPDNEESLLALSNQGRIPRLQNRFNEFFRSDQTTVGASGLFVRNYLCESDNSVANTPYENLLCPSSTTFPVSVIAEKMHYLAWQQIGINTLLLRAEKLGHPALPYLMPLRGTQSNTNVNTISAQFNTAEFYNLPSSLRSQIRESSIKRIFFVPVAYVENIRGVVPKLLTKAIWIDFNFLRRQLQLNQPALIASDIAPTDLVNIQTASYEPGIGAGDIDTNDVVNFPFRRTGIADPLEFIQDNPATPGFHLFRYAIDRANSDSQEAFNVRVDGSVRPDDNNIRRKYVLVFGSIGGGNWQYGDAASEQINGYASEWLLNMAANSNQTLRIPISHTENPFTAPCSVGFVRRTDNDGNVVDIGHRTNWFAIAFNFNATEELISYTTRWCFASRNGGDSTSAGDAGIASALIAELNDQCTEYVQVYDGSKNALSEDTNKAWTNRVWRGAFNPGSTLPLRHPLGEYGEKNGQEVIVRSQTANPFGSLSLPGNLIDDTNANRQPLLNYAFDGYPFALGIPYSCLSAFNSSPRVGPFGIPCLNAFSGVQPYNDQFRIVVQSNDQNTGRTAIAELFARSFRSARLSANRGGYDLPLPGLDRSGQVEFQEARIARTGAPTVVEPLSVPRIFSLNPATCFVQGQNCTAAEPDNMTVNRRNQFVPLKDYNNDRIFDEDADADGSPDPIIGRNSETITLQFFAAADDNRMPIRQVTVDWGDGRDNITNDGIRGLYKNHKPFCGQGTGSAADVGLCATALPNDRTIRSLSILTCQGDDDCPRELLGETTPGVRCVTPENLALLGPGPLGGYSVPRFGNARRACDQTPFEFEHTYLCTAAMLADTTANPQVRAVSTLPQQIQTRLIQTTRVTPADPVCVYRPRVHVRDNWGYCNGRCAGDPAGERCYGVREEEECNYNISSINIQDRGNTPWTEYRGYIIVVPQR